MSISLSISLSLYIYIYIYIYMSIGGSVVDHALASGWTWVRSRPRPTTEWATNQPHPQSLRGNLKPEIPQVIRTSAAPVQE